MPFLIWTPSCAAGPLNTAACPRMILSDVTPCANAACENSAAPMISSFFMLDPHSKKVRVLHPLHHVEFLPHPALGIGVLRARPRRQPALAPLELRRIAQAER